MLPGRRNNDLRVFTDAFEDFFKTGFSLLGEREIKISIKDQEESFELKAELPGVEKEDIQITYENDQLIISANKEETTELEKENYVYKETKNGVISRSLHLPNVKIDQSEASYTNGVLTMRIPKKERNERDNRIHIDIK